MSAAKAPKITHTCCGTLRNENPWVNTSYLCGKSAKFERKGEWFCGTHDPDRIDAKRAETRARWKAQWDEDERVGRLNRSAPDLLAALKCFVADERFVVSVGGNPIVVEKMIEDARAAIKKAEGKAP